MQKKCTYDAFISYRHISPDKDIAAALQRLLENFVPPKALREKGKFEKFRVFRDETELPTSSNLSDGIRSALESSKYLIVICSPSYSQSRWCMEELRLFKQLHGGSNANIITVAAHGAPQDIFPQELCHETVCVAQEDGSIRREERTIEPLAANVAAGIVGATLKKLRQEYLRVAAPLTGCGYNDLYNRQQRKKTRTILTVSAAIIAFLLLFTGYTAYMLQRISAQHDALRLSTAESLTKQAQMYLEDGDKLSAVSTALEAMPQGKKDAVQNNPAAEQVINDALQMYSANERQASHTVTLPSYVAHLKATEDGSRLLAVDTSNNVHIIDPEQKTILRTYSALELFGESANYYAEDICIDSTTAYLLSHSTLAAVDLTDGSKKWMYASAEPLFSFDCVCTNDASDRVLLCGYATAVVSKSDGSELYWKDDQGFSSFGTGQYLSAEGCSYYFDPDGSYVLPAGADAFLPLPITVPASANILGIGENDSCIFLHHSIPDAESAANMICIRKADHTVLWESACPVQNAGYAKNLVLQPYLGNHYLSDEEYYTREGILSVTGKDIVLRNPDTGEIYFHCGLEEELLFLRLVANDNGLHRIQLATETYFNESCTLLSQNHILLSGGKDTVVRFGTDCTFRAPCTYVTHAKGQLFATAAESSPDILITYNAQPLNAATFVSSGSQTWESLGYCHAFAHNGASLAAAVATQSVDDGSVTSLVLLDTSQNTWQSTQIPSPRNGSRPKNLYFLTENVLLVHNSDNSCTVLDTSGKVLEEFLLEDAFRAQCGIPESDSIYFSDAPFLSDGVMYLYSNRHLLSANWDGTAMQWKLLYQAPEGFLCDFNAQGNLSVFLRQKSPGENICLLPLNGEVQILSENGTPVDFPDESISCLISSGTQVAFYHEEGYIGIYAPNDAILRKISVRSAPLQMIFSPDEKYILALSANGECIRYNISALCEDGSCKPGMEVNEHFRMEFCTESKLLLHYSIHACILDITEMTSWATVENFALSLPGQKKILFDSYKDPGTYDLLTGDALQAAANDAIQ